LQVRACRVQTKSCSRSTAYLNDSKIAAFFSAYAALAWSAGRLLDVDNNMVAELNAPSAKSRRLTPVIAFELVIYLPENLVN
jgi:hypothetical protein